MSRLKSLLEGSSLSLFLLLLIPICSVVVEAGSRVIKTTSEIKSIISSNNYDIRILQEQVKRASAIVSGVKGAYYPSLDLDASYLDDQKEPFSNFQPSRTQNSRWGASLKQKSPLGMTTTIGLTTDKTKLFQTDPPNEFLPYPLSLHQPAMYVKFEMDVLQDLMGYISLKEWDQVKIDEDVSKLHVEKIRKKLYASSSSLFLNIKVLEEMQAVIGKLLKRLQELERDVESKVRNRIAEESDLYKLRASIAQRKADLVVMKRNLQEVERMLSAILSLEGDTIFEPSQSLSAVVKEISACEESILREESFDTAWSSQFEILKKNIKRGGLEREIAYRKALPDVSFVGSYTGTGLDESFGAGFSEATGGESPQYYLGLNLSWPLSKSVARSTRIFGDTALETSGLAYSKELEESRVLFGTARKKIRYFKEEGELVDSAVSFGRKQVKDLGKRFKQGRVSMFELVLEEGAVMQSELKQKQLWMERINNVYQILGNFDRYECGNGNVLSESVVE